MKMLSLTSPTRNGHKSGPEEINKKKLLPPMSISDPPPAMEYRPSRRRLAVAARLRFASSLDPGTSPVYRADLLVDSGATDCFIDRKMAFRLGLPLFAHAQPIPVALADGRTPVSGSITHWTAMDIRTRNLRTTAVFHIIDCPKNPFILGYDWLERINPDIDWRKGTVVPHPLHDVLPLFWPTRVPTHQRDTARKISVLSAQKFSTIRFRDPIYLATVNVIQQKLEEPTVSPSLPQQYSNYASVFAGKDDCPFPPRHPIDLRIDLLPGKQPPWGPVYRLTQEEEKTLREYITDLLARGVIRPSTSSCSAPVLFAPKKDGTLRLCIDYRGLNAITKKNRYPLPLIEDVIHSMRGSKIFTKLDLRDAYHNIRIAAGDEWKTAFRTKYGLFEYTCVPFGLANAPPTFQAFVDTVFGDLLYKAVVVYLDNILIYSCNEVEHQELVTDVLRRLKKNHLYAKLSKCEFHKASVEFLGHLISADGIRMDPAKVSSITEWPVPSCSRDVQAFLGLANYYRTFVSNFSNVAVPLTELLKKDVKFEWTSQHQHAFATLKRKFAEEVILAYPNPDKPFIVETDASGFALGGILSQEDSQGRLRPIAFHSRKLSSAEHNYEIASH